MNCPKCQTPAVKNGSTPSGKQKYRCKACGYNFEGDRQDAKTDFPPIASPPMSSKIAGLTETQLRAKHDIRFIVATKCKELKAGAFLTRSEFIQFCGIRPGQGYTDVIGHPDYDDYRGKAPGGVVYYSHPDSIRKLKSEGVLT